MTPPDTAQHLTAVSAQGYWSLRANREQAVLLDAHGSVGMNRQYCATRQQFDDRSTRPTKGSDLPPATHVQVLHDDGQWYEADLLDQHRSGDRWRAVVRYSVAPGLRYQRGMWADELRPAHRDSE